MEAIPKIGGYLSCFSAQVFHPLDAIEESRLEISYFVLRATIRHMVVSSRRANNRQGRAREDYTGALLVASSSDQAQALNAAAATALASSRNARDVARGQRVVEFEDLAGIV